MKAPLTTPMEVTVEKMVYKGLGLAHTPRGVLFIPNTYPGDKLSICDIYKKKGVLYGEVKKVLTPSPFRHTSPCTHFPKCGGCQMIDVRYPDQLTLKTNIVKDCLGKLPHLIDMIQPIIPSPDVVYYRNKMDYAFGTDTDGQLIIGLKKRGHFDKVCPIEHCHLQSEASNTIRQFTETFFREAGETARNPVTHEGNCRHLIIRESKNNAQAMVILVTAKANTALYQKYGKALKLAFPEIQSIFHSLNTSQGDHTFPDKLSLLEGATHITETLGALQFNISPYSFFQTNSHGAEVLYKEICEAAQVTKTDTVLDLYCGTGTIGLYLAPHVKFVTGIEEVESATEDAHRNAQMNQIQNIRFITGNVKNILKQTPITANIIIMDPPRAGIAPKALRRIIGLRAKKIVYVSCNPNTMARDLEQLEESGYTVQSMRLMDMFPNTYHVETITVLTHNFA
ncbi:23S rRNA (uracil(1939)-C(5))-methyltransferase RlmD [bacterium]|jgi:23S rRNA (uracil1939-C5)-methyltransferase|nr:23S rRNA (uracil(1939)-C(5))-methyltransferase RlmD [bacterium]